MPFLPKPISDPRISPDGNRVVLDIRNEVDRGDVWMLDLSRAALAPLIDLGNERHPIWSPDGSRVLFASLGSGSGDFRLYSQASDGTGAPDPLIRGGIVQFPLSFSPDGKYLLTRGMGGPNWNLNLLSMARSPVSRRWLPMSSSKRTAKFHRTADGLPTGPGHVTEGRVRAPVFRMWRRAAG